MCCVVLFGFSVPDLDPAVSRQKWFSPARMPVSSSWCREGIAPHARRRCSSQCLRRAATMPSSHGSSPLASHLQRGVLRLSWWACTAGTGPIAAVRYARQTARLGRRSSHALPLEYSRRVRSLFILSRTRRPRFSFMPYDHALDFFARHDPRCHWRHWDRRGSLLYFIL